VTLAGFYSGDTKEVNSDVESQLKQFYNYANQFLIRDSIFEATIAKIDISIKNDKMRKKELDGLKALRDRIVVDNFIYAVSTGDTSKLLYSASQVMNNPDFIKGIDAQEIIKLISTGYSCFQTISNSGQSFNIINAIDNIISSFSVSSAQSATNQYVGNYSYVISFDPQFVGSFNQEMINLISEAAMSTAGNANSAQNAGALTFGVVFNFQRIGAAGDQNIGAAGDQNIGAAGDQNIGAAASNPQIGMAQTAVANQFSIGIFNPSQIGIIYMGVGGISSAIIPPA
jgi:hypothetical protein